MADGAGWFGEHLILGLRRASDEVLAELYSRGDLLQFVAAGRQVEAVVGRRAAAPEWRLRFFDAVRNSIELVRVSSAPTLQ